VNAILHAGMQRVVVDPNATSLPLIISLMNLHSKLKILLLLTFAVDSNVLMMTFANMAVPMPLNAITISLTAIAHIWCKFMTTKLRRR
jgi:hypothetical protein